MLKAMCICYLGHINEAVKNYDKAIEVEPKPVYYLNKALSLKDLGKFEKSLACVDISIAKFLALNSYDKTDLTDAYFNKGLIHKQLVAFTAALKSFEDALKPRKNKEYSREIHEIKALLAKAKLKMVSL